MTMPKDWSAPDARGTLEDIPCGHEVYDQVCKRIADEKAKAAEQLALQLIEIYMGNLSRRTTIELTVTLGGSEFRDLALRYRFDQEVRVNATGILKKKGWNFRCESDRSSNYILSPIKRLAQEATPA